MQADERFRLDYEQTTELIRALLDVRFRLLALVPTIAGAAVAFLGSHGTVAELLGLGLLGLLATVGLLLYDLRNTQIFDAAEQHARALERLLGLDVARRASGAAGVLSETVHGRLFAIVPIGEDQALGLIYGAALGGWTYLVAWGALRALHFSAAREVGGVIGLLCAVAVMFEMGRVGIAARRVGRGAVAD